MPSRLVSSWGNVIHAKHDVLSLKSRFSPLPKLPAGASMLPFGNGRSYGDSCLNVGGALLQTASLDRFMRFDREAGQLTCESGVLLADILRLAVPAGWFPPVVPGTRFVTIGGAIANDIHGKNHHRLGTFGRHVRQLELLRSDGERLRCSATENPSWFAATIGGLGLTGAVVSAEMQLRPIAGPMLDVETVRFANLDGFFELSAESDGDFEYTVAWIDCLARGRHLGRGLFQRANHSSAQARAAKPAGALGMPFVPPISLVNALSLRIFNTCHYRRQRASRVRSCEHYETFFFPLDRIHHWNRMYGPRGFYQYQCVIPTRNARPTIGALLEAIAHSGLGSFLAVLKHCGAVASPGMLSFPLPGVTLALDFPNDPRRLEALFVELDRLVGAADGRLYPAKDGRMPGELFRTGYPRWREFTGYVDPRFSSTFWRRVAENA